MGLHNVVNHSYKDEGFESKFSNNEREIDATTREMWGKPFSVSIPKRDTPSLYFKRQLANLDQTTGTETRSNTEELEFHFAHRHRTRHEEDLMGRCDRLLG